jgi:hypothetical protein
MEPGGVEYRGARELSAFVRVAMSGRVHDAAHRVEITNWFADEENLCVEYTHGAVLTGRITGGVRGTLKPGLSRFCITYHLRESKVDRVHEDINGTRWWVNLLSPIGLFLLHRRVRRALSS